MPNTEDILYYTAQQLKHSCGAAQDSTMWTQSAAACGPTKLRKGNPSI